MRYYFHMTVNSFRSWKLAEPDSRWWQELRVLLKYQQSVDAKLFDAWARKLADATRDTHRVPASTIRRWMNGWRHDLTVDDILDCVESLQTPFTTYPS